MATAKNTKKRQPGRPLGPRPTRKELIRAIQLTMQPSLSNAMASMNISSPNRFYKLLREENILCPDGSIDLRVYPPKPETDFLS